MAMKTIADNLRLDMSNGTDQRMLHETRQLAVSQQNVIMKDVVHCAVDGESVKP